MAMVARLVSLAIVFAVLVAVTTVPRAEGAVTCGQVVNSLYPCVSYLMNGGNMVPGQCCNGIRNLYGMATNTPDRRAVCTCIKQAVSNSGFSFTSYNLNLAAGLPKKCGVNIPYQISPNTDCSRVQ
ncbi:non-specific lipid-transfer protein 1-like [Lotus japonicus]|uniref:non-specific lipid-transfer protein 1-like n=1 Tax=Lotus japonicus TaxID=34305 RepID=UPI00258481EA|nr:non-specific lipid-transfer protein 1-like [Lotus japonicus]